MQDFTKICSRCGVEKPIDRFGKRGDKYRGVCKDCYNLDAKAKYPDRKEYLENYYTTNAEVVKERKHQYYLANKEELRVKRKVYDAEHAEDNKRRGKQYRAENAEYLRAWHKDYRERNKDLVASRKAKWQQTEQYKEYQRRYYLENLDKLKPVMLKAFKEYYQNNKEYYKRKRLERRARKANAEGTHTKDEVEQVRVVQGNLCVYCGVSLVHAGTHEDHYMPLSKGGSDYIENIQLLCPSCNLSKGPKHPDVYEAQIGFDRAAWEAKFGRCLSTTKTI